MQPIIQELVMTQADRDNLKSQVESYQKELHDLRNQVMILQCENDIMKKRLTVFETDKGE
jgi:predicted  nucleic acid-binding Zn-ribbon protein